MQHVAQIPDNPPRKYFSPHAPATFMSGLHNMLVGLAGAGGGVGALGGGVGDAG